MWAKPDTLMPSDFTAFICLQNHFLMPEKKKSAQKRCMLFCMSVNRSVLFNLFSVLIVFVLLVFSFLFCASSVVSWRRFFYEKVCSAAAPFVRDVFLIVC